MIVKTFAKGIKHLPHRKTATAAKPVETVPLPPEIVLPLSQHTGAEAEPLVSKGEQVEKGQKIAAVKEGLGVPLHTPVTGKVKAVEPRWHYSGVKMLSIVIEPSDQQPAAAKKLENFTGRFAQPSPEEVRQLVKEAGLVGLGGAAFPTYVKLTPPPDAEIDSVIINGCECEPYLTADHRLMLEEPEAILAGLKIIMQTVGAQQGYIGIETNKPDAIETLANLVKEPNIEVVPLESKYPQGSEKHLIKAVLNREVPAKGLPSAVGVLVQNVATTVAIYKAVEEGQPLIEKIITVSGEAVKEPKNLRVPIGTPVDFILKHCGGLTEDVGEVIYGGPMMGVALSQLQVPVVKATSGIIALSRAEVAKKEVLPCIKCGSCLAACPMNLMPYRLAALAEQQIWDELEQYYLFDCIECGCCAYVCPSRRPLVQYIKLAKAKLKQR